MGILTFRHCDVKMTSYIKFFMNLNSRPKNNPLYQIWAWSSNYLENNSSFFVWHTVNKRLLLQPLMRMVIDKICKMTVKGVKSKSESFFSISHGVLDLWRKTWGGGSASPPPPGMDRVKSFVIWIIKLHNFVNICSKCMTEIVVERFWEGQLHYKQKAQKILKFQWSQLRQKN